MSAKRPFSVPALLIFAVISITGTRLNAQQCTQLSQVEPEFVTTDSKDDVAHVHHWAVLFNCATYGTDAQARQAADLFETNLAKRMSATSIQGVGFQGWLAGESASLAFATGIALRNRGLSNAHIEELLAGDHTYSFLPDPDVPCGFSGFVHDVGFLQIPPLPTKIPQWQIGTTCFEDYAISTEAYAWRAAYRKVVGDARWTDDLNATVQKILNSVDPDDSICAYDTSTYTTEFDNPDYNGGRGPCKAASENPIPLLDAHPEFFIPLNHTQENANYGIGIVSSLAHAYAGLPAGGIDPSQSPAYQNALPNITAVMKALFYEGQQASDSGGGGYVDNCYYPTDYPFLNPPASKKTGDADRALFAPDMQSRTRVPPEVPAEGKTTCMDRTNGGYKPGMYQVLPFYQALFNSVVPPDDHTKFRFSGNFPDGDFKIAANQPIGDFFGWGRYLVYHTVGSEWFDPKDGLPVALCVPVITAPASVDGGKSATASAAAPPGAASYRWTITNGIITSADDQQSVTFTAGSSGTVELKLTTFGVCTGTTHNSRTVSIPIIGCDATLSQTSIAAPGDGANHTLAVTLSRQDCPWTAVSHDDWIFVYTGASGVGNGFVGISVGPNPGANRTGSLTIAGVTVTVTQHALCTYNVAPICLPS